MTDRIARNGAKAIFEQYVYKKLKEEEYVKKYGKRPVVPRATAESKDLVASVQKLQSERKEKEFA